MQINAIKSCDMNFNRSSVVAVVARNKQNFTFISFNAGTVKEYTVTWIIFILPPWRGSIIRYGRNREFTLILCVIPRLYGALIHAYSIHESTLIQCVNLRLFDAWMHACTFTKRQLSLVRMWSHARGFRGSCVFKSCYFAWQEYLDISENWFNWPIILLRYLSWKTKIA